MLFRFVRPMFRDGFRNGYFNRRDPACGGLKVVTPMGEEFVLVMRCCSARKAGGTESITTLLTAAENGGEEAVRFHAEVIADFERKRVEIVNPALASRPWAVTLKEPRWDSPELADLEVDLEDLSLIGPTPPKKALAAPAAAKRTRVAALKGDRINPTRG